MGHVIPRDYSFIAPVYDQVFNRALSEGHRRIGQLLRKKRPRKECKVLEVGVGSGLTFDYLPNSIEFTGIDINQKMLSLAYKKAEKLKRKKISLALMDAQKLAYKSYTFDFVFAASVISAVEDPVATMHEMIRVTKKGGRIAIIANFRETNTLKSLLLKCLDPLTKKFLGFRTDMKKDFFLDFKTIRVLESEEVNNVLGFPLSTFMLFEKL